MKNWSRIILIASLLIGSALFFAYWSFGELNNSISSISDSQIAVADIPLVVYFSRETNNDEKEISTTTPENISITSDIAFNQSSTTESISLEQVDLKTSLVLHNESNQFYIGCTYRVSFQSSTIIRSVAIALVDAGTLESVGPIASGLAKTYEIKDDSQSIDWKVGAVWPGRYFISISKINGIEEKVKSKYFTILRMPEDINISGREIICKGSGGELL